MYVIPKLKTGKVVYSGVIKITLMLLQLRHMSLQMFLSSSRTGLFSTDGQLPASAQNHKHLWWIHNHI